MTLLGWMIHKISKCYADDVAFIGELCLITSGSRASSNVECRLGSAISASAFQPCVRQSICHATSKDGVVWVKNPANPIICPLTERYESLDWRDPYIFHNDDDGCWWLLISARRKDGPAPRRGCVILYRSADLKEWKYYGPIYEPYHTNCPECPEMYKIGDGVKQNDREAVKWLRLATEWRESVNGGEIEYIDNANDSLAEMYQQGRGIEENDEQEVVQWYQRQAKNGYDMAQFALGQRYQEGKGVEQNDAEAIMWFLLAAAQRNQDAKNALTDMDRQGRGVVANYEDVTQLLELSVKEGNRSAKDILESLQKSNSTESQ